MTEILVPIFICVVLPVSIVLIVFLTKAYQSREQTKILMKAMEVNPNIDTDRLAESLRKRERTPLQVLNLRLLRGCIFTLIGIGLIVCGCVTYYAGGHTFGEDPILLPTMLGFVSLAVGVSYLIVFFVTRKQAREEMSHHPENEKK